MIEKFFKLTQNRTNVRTEILAGVTTFFTMAYIIFVNPQILHDGAGMDMASVMVATCLAAALGTFIIGIASNYPLAQAPGMGFNAFFAFVLVAGFGLSVQAALAAVFLGGLLMVLATATQLRSYVLNSIPASLKRAIAAGIGVFIALLGLYNSGLVVQGGPLITLGNMGPPQALTVLGLVISTALVVRKISGALFIGIILTAIAGLVFQFVLQMDVGIRQWTGYEQAGIRLNYFGVVFGGIRELFDVRNLPEGMTLVTVISILVSMGMMEVFGTMGTLVGAAEKAGFIDEDGNLPRAKEALVSDGVATLAGAALGTSTVTTYIESVSGVSEGGRTGLTSMVVGVLFLFSLLLFPFLGFIPAAATAPALIIVGVYMITTISGIDWGNFEDALPAFLTMTTMAFTFDITNGIGFGVVSYAAVRLVKLQFKKSDVVIFILAGLFVLHFLNL